MRTDGHAVENLHKSASCQGGGRDGEAITLSAGLTVPSLGAAKTPPMPAAQPLSASVLITFAVRMVSCLEVLLPQRCGYAQRAGADLLERLPDQLHSSMLDGSSAVTIEVHVIVVTDASTGAAGGGRGDLGLRGLRPESPLGEAELFGRGCDLGLELGGPELLSALEHGRLHPAASSGFGARAAGRASFGHALRERAARAALLSAALLLAAGGGPAAWALRQPPARRPPARALASRSAERLEASEDRAGRGRPHAAAAVAARALPGLAGVAAGLLCAVGPALAEGGVEPPSPAVAVLAGALLLAGAAAADSPGGEKQTKAESPEPEREPKEKVAPVVETQKGEPAKQEATRAPRVDQHRGPPRPAPSSFRPLVPACFSPPPPRPGRLEGARPWSSPSHTRAPRVPLGCLLSLSLFTLLVAVWARVRMRNALSRLALGRPEEEDQEQQGRRRRRRRRPLVAMAAPPDAATSECQGEVEVSAPGLLVEGGSDELVAASVAGPYEPSGWHEGRRVYSRAATDRAAGEKRSLDHAGLLLGGQ
ncbi:unnamed protein product [Prorocentrum cordatum]|uniref:Uncharacterized protein n=1 Tax=Prorocentrum cordatum TaxID=2364126 RepID=A0ABN9S2K8_9DINO|nr:unnamed protein product [Polarella glacialis]